VSMDGASELLAVAATLEKTGLAAPAIATGIVTKGAQNIKEAMQADAQGINHAPHFPDSINYDVNQTLGGPEAEIGPDKGRTQGALGNILYFGTSKNGPVRDISVGIDAEAPKFEKALGEAAEPKL
jgi:hypothetical protein